MMSGLSSHIFNIIQDGSLSEEQDCLQHAGMESRPLLPLAATPETYVVE
jgi:hypothetical protein